MDCGVSVSSSMTMMSLLLAERDRFWVGQVRSITPGLAFRFRDLNSVIGWSTVSFMRVASFLFFEACKLFPRPSCSSSAAARSDDPSELVVDHEGLPKEGKGRTYLDGSKARRSHSPFPRTSYPTTVLECPVCWRTSGMHSVTATAPLSAPFTV